MNAAWLTRFVRCLLVGLAVPMGGGSATAEGQAPLLNGFLDRNDVIPGEQTTVLRLDIDVTGDGQPELLLALASRHRQAWSAYSWTGVNQLKYLGEVGFPYWGFLLEADPTRLVAAYELESGQPGVATYEVDASGIRLLSLDDGSDPDAPIPDFSAWQKEVNLRVPGASLGDVLQDPSPEWLDQLDPSHKPVAGIGGLLELSVEGE